MCILLLWCQLQEMLAFVWPEQRTETKSSQSDWTSLFVAEWPSVLLCSTFWMLSSTRPPRTYTLSASTVSKAEMKEELKKKKNSIRQRQYNKYGHRNVSIPGMVAWACDLDSDRTKVATHTHTDSTLFLGFFFSMSGEMIIIPLRVGRHAPGDDDVCSSNNAARLMRRCVVTQHLCMERFHKRHQTKDSRNAGIVHHNYTVHALKFLRCRSAGLGCSQQIAWHTDDDRKTLIRGAV